MIVDHGWLKIDPVRDNAFIDVVDESKGAHRANEIKPVEITLIMDDSDALYNYLIHKTNQRISPPRKLETMYLWMFLLHDLEGYLTELQKFLKWKRAFEPIISLDEEIIFLSDR